MYNLSCSSRQNKDLDIFKGNMLSMKEKTAIYLPSIIYNVVVKLKVSFSLKTCITSYVHCKFFILRPQIELSENVNNNFFVNFIIFTLNLS